MELDEEKVWNKAVELFRAMPGATYISMWEYDLFNWEEAEQNQHWVFCYALAKQFVALETAIQNISKGQ